MRVERWPTLMREVIEEHRDQEFAWGKSDCSMFADIVKVMTGIDPLENIRGYSTPEGAIKRLKKEGYESVLQLVEDKFKEIHSSLAGRGDLGYPDEIGSSLMSPAVIDGVNSFSKGPEGFVVMPKGVLVRTFKVE